MGRVYEVEHIELGKRFVLKALQRELARRQDLVARLRNEWRALARLEHPNIVSVTDAGTSQNGVPFYVMERLEGETLSMLVHRQRRLLPQQALGIAAGILDGLHAAHQIGVVHRDVKPPNIFLTGPLAVKVLDFGIAKIKDAKDVITARGIAVGTPRYMSPEQARGTAVDARSDIYATGLMLFEMVSGVGPYDDARDHNELLVAQLSRQAPLLSSVSVVAPELDALVFAMLAKDPRERPASAQQVAQTLRDLSQRYARYAGTETPTVNAQLRPVPLEVPTRVEGQRRAVRPASQTAPTRPDGAAAARGAPEGDRTIEQSPFEIATTAVVALPGPNITQRLPPPAPAPATLYGSDTLVDPLTRAPLSLPGPAQERTEPLLLPPGAPGRGPLTDPGPTRTSVPLAESGSNLTPPPVVPMQPSAKPARSMVALVIAAALGGMALFGAGLLLLRPDRAASPVPSAPSPQAAAPAPPLLAAEPTPRQQPAMVAAARSEPVPPAPVAAAPSVAPIPGAAPPPTARNQEKKLPFPTLVVAPAGPPVTAASAETRPKASASMPGSGL
jgi:serine/threonine-protein kinase